MNKKLITEIQNSDLETLIEVLSKVKEIAGDALFEAVLERNQKNARKLIQAGADVNFVKYNGWTPLMQAASDGQKEIAQRLIDEGADFDMQNHDGLTALMFAVNEGEKEIAQILIDAGARIDMKNNDGLTALMIAAQENRKEIFDMLIDIDLIKKGLATAPIEGLKIFSQKVEEKDSYGRDYTF